MSVEFAYRSSFGVGPESARGRRQAPIGGARRMQAAMGRPSAVTNSAHASPGRPARMRRGTTAPRPAGSTPSGRRGTTTGPRGRTSVSQRRLPTHRRTVTEPDQAAPHRDQGPTPMTNGTGARAHGTGQQGHRAGRSVDSMSPATGICRWPRIPSSSTESPRRDGCGVGGPVPSTAGVPPLDGAKKAFHAELQEVCRQSGSSAVAVSPAGGGEVSVEGAPGHRRALQVRRGTREATPTGALRRPQGLWRSRRACPR